jgi:hypothetical protein
MPNRKGPDVGYRSRAGCPALLIWPRRGAPGSIEYSTGRNTKVREIGVTIVFPFTCGLGLRVRQFPLLPDKQANTGMGIPGTHTPNLSPSRLSSHRARPNACGGTGRSAAFGMPVRRGEMLAVLCECPGRFDVLPNATRACVEWPAVCRSFHDNRSERRF